MSKRTKIVATIGPSCSEGEVLKSMIKEGVNVFRVNFSHGSHQDHIDAIKKIRLLDKELGTHSAILADLQGPKIRIGDMPKEGLLLENNQEFILTTLEDHNFSSAAQIFIDRIPKDVKVGEKVLLDDGKIHLEVLETNLKDTVKTKVIAGGLLFSKKGLNLPDTNINISSLTKKDKADLVIALEHEVDWIGFSFVRSAREVIELRHLINSNNGNAKIIAKIEKPEAVENIDSLIPYCDGLMVARGDLGVEIPMQEVPLIQKMLVNKAKKARIPVIIATQMMETMIENSVPTRAEVNDVANSIMDGADALMLSGETSVGKNPIRVIQKMTEIIKSVENSPLIKVPQSAPHIRTDRFITKAICHHAALMANDTNAKAICTFTKSGYTAFQISAWRPKAHVLAFSSEKRILGKLNLLWGVNAFFYDKNLSTDDTVIDINKISKEKGFVKEGDLTINLTSMPVEAKGMVNTLRTSEIK